MKRFQRLVERVECVGVAIQPFRERPQRVGARVTEAMWIGKSIDYLGWPRRRFHSPRAERMKVKPPSPPSAQSVQTKKKPPADLAISP